MTEIDLRTARPGCVVEFRCGGKATVTGVRPGDEWVRMDIEGAVGTRSWGPHGNYTMFRGGDMWDIVSITQPPLTDADRLREIAKIVRRERERSIGAGVQCLAAEILALAEGYQP